MKISTYPSLAVSFFGVSIPIIADVLVDKVIRKCFSSFSQKFSSWGPADKTFCLHVLPTIAGCQGLALIHKIDFLGIGGYKLALSYVVYSAYKIVQCALKRPAPVPAPHASRRVLTLEEIAECQASVQADNLKEATGPDIVPAPLHAESVQLLRALIAIHLKDGSSEERPQILAKMTVEYFSASTASLNTGNTPELVHAHLTDLEDLRQSEQTLEEQRNVLVAKLSTDTIFCECLPVATSLG